MASDRVKLHDSPPPSPPAPAPALFAATGGATAFLYFSKDMDCTMTTPGPVSVLLKRPSPPKQHVQQPPAVRTPNLTVGAQPTTLSVSMTMVSPSASTFVSTVPPADRKAVPSPVMFWRMKPRPPQRHVQGLQSQLMPTEMSPEWDMYAPFLAMNEPLVFASSTGITLAGKSLVRAMKPSSSPRLVYTTLQHASPAQVRVMVPHSAEPRTPLDMNIMAPGSLVMAWPGASVTVRTWQSAPVMS
mmetsp:Transcript_17287/g.58692  ORF Transcript_17287/g.58692 Transcript_17287/m.58692 type:complete len:243 (+) Transcript_17287:107-835(+)